MKTFKQLREEWYKTIDFALSKYSSHKKLTVYKNPKGKELRELTRDVRGLLVSNKYVYMWNANDARHTDVWEKVLSKSEQKKFIMNFEGAIIGGNFIVDYQTYNVNGKDLRKIPYFKRTFKEVVGD